MIKEEGNANLKRVTGQSIVHKKYTVHRMLYEGENSSIYTVLFEKNEKQITRIIKMEEQTSSRSDSKDPLQFLKANKLDSSVQKRTIKAQTNVLKKIFTNQNGKVHRAPGFPRLYEYGNENNVNFMILDFHGPNLAQLMKLCGGTFSHRTAIFIALQIVDRIETLHEKKYLYNNFCPENFITGLGPESYLIFMIDFGNSILYKSQNSNTHVPFQKRQYDIDLMFSSVNVHLQIQPSRRDDLESLLYLLVYMIRGKLPWVKIQGKTRKQKEDSVLDLKRKIPPQSLLKSMSFQICDIFYYIKTLSFYEKPDYDLIRKKLWGALMQTNFEELKKGVISFDWNAKDDLDFQIYRQIPGIRLKRNITSQESECDEDSQRQSNNQKMAALAAEPENIDQCIKQG